MFHPNDTSIAIESSDVHLDSFVFRIDTQQMGNLGVVAVPEDVDLLEVITQDVDLLCVDASESRFSLNDLPSLAGEAFNRVMAR